MKTVGILVNGYLDYVGIHAGGNVHVINMARNLEGFHVVFFGPQRARADFLAAVPGSEFVSMPDFPWLPSRINLLVRGVFGTLRRSQLRKPDVLLATSHHIPDILPAMAARPDRTVVTIHHFLGKPSERYGGALYNMASWLGQEASLFFVRRCAARFAFDSPHVMNEGAALVANRPAVLTMSGVAPPPGFVPAPLQGRTGGIYLGRLHSMKRVADAIVAWNELPPAFRAQPLRIVGADQGAYAAELVKLVADLGLESSVQFVGHVDEAAKWRLLNESSIFVFPSAEEGWGLAIAEAMAAGLPCVTYDLPVYREIFTRGRVEVPLADTHALSRACAELLSDDARRARLAQEGKELAATFTWKGSAAILQRALTF